MPSLQELFEDIMNFAQEGGPMVESGELRLERQLAEMLNRQAWLDLYHDDRKLFLAHDETEFALFNRDPFSESEVDKLAQAFDASDWEVRETLVGLYGNMNLAYRYNAGAEQRMAADGIYAPPHMSTVDERMHTWFLKAERCAEKALDMLGIPAEDTLYLPANAQNRTFFLLFWNLAATKQALNKMEECRHYLEFCLRIRPPDPEIAELWEDARRMYFELR